MEQPTSGYRVAVLPERCAWLGHLMTGASIRLLMAPGFRHMCHASLDWVTLDDPQKVAHKHQEISRLATTKHDVPSFLYTVCACQFGSLRAYSQCNAGSGCAIQIRQEQSPLVEQGMHEPLEIYKPRASFAWCYLIRLIFSPNPIRQRTSHIALPPCTLPASRHVGDTRAHP